MSGAQMVAGRSLFKSYGLGRLRWRRLRRYRLYRKRRIGLRVRIALGDEKEWSRGGVQATRDRSSRRRMNRLQQKAPGLPGL